MLSSTFMQEGRIKIELPQASLAPTGKQKSDPLVVAVTQSGIYRVNERELINASPDTLRAAILEVAGADRDKPVTVRADARATHQSVVTAMDVLGKLGFVRINIATVEDSESAEMNASQGVSPVDAKGVYRRLLGYARPHLGMFLIGVVGMALFAATGPAFAWLVQNFVDLGFVKKDPSVLWLVPLGAPLLFLLRGVGDYIGVYFPGYVSRQIIKALRRDLFRQYLNFPAKYYDQQSTRHDALAAHVQHRAGGRGDDQFHRRADPRLAHHHPADRAGCSCSTGSWRCSS